MTATDILKQWLTFAEYDPKQRAFNLLSVHYQYHKICEAISKFLAYDPDAKLSVLYAKSQFAQVLKECRVSVFDVVSNPDSLHDEIEMWRLFNSPAVSEIEDSVLDSFDAILSRVQSVKKLGNRDKEQERKALLDSIEAVVDSLDKCNVDLFLRGGEMIHLTNFSTNIHVFPRLADCLLALECAQDGMYLCYIRANDSADGYFGFFLKSNGNLLSINERVNEAYPGSHGNSRNGRWAEAKKADLFPYSFLIDHEYKDEDGNTHCSTDYKGYYKDYFINEDKLAFLDLQPSAYMPLVIAMMLLSGRYAGFDTTGLPVRFVNSMLPVNLALPTPGTQALTVPDNSLVVRQHEQLDVKITSQDVLRGTHLTHLGRKESLSAEMEDFYDFKNGQEQIFIDLYGADFQLDTSKILQSDPHLKRLTSAELATTKDKPHPEFVGDKDRFLSLAYMQARQQLADHIRTEMHKEYLAFGGAPAVDKWWQDVLTQHKDTILRRCIERYHKGQSYTWKNAEAEGIPEIRMYLDQRCRPTCNNGYGYDPLPLNDYVWRNGRSNYDVAACCITGQAASHYFSFRINSWEDMAWLVGEENIPKIVKGYRSRGHRGLGNEILDITDSLTRVGTPMEDYEANFNRIWWSKSKWDDHYFHSLDPDWLHKKAPATALPWNPKKNFTFAVALSKRGLAKLLKETEA